MAQTVERRDSRQIRPVLVQACELLEAIVAGMNSRNTMSNFAMARYVQQNFPELSSAEIHITVIAVENFRRNERVNSL